jgi:eukaryotic-like serine/threonine-protein kinase
MFMLGQGGMGEVHLARLTGAAGFEKLCIVKTILPAMQADVNFVERFHHEARVLVQLTHSHIAQVYDMGEADGTLYMSIEYVAGVDLSRVLRRVQLAQTVVPIPIAISLAQQVAEALGYAHRKTGPDGVPLDIVHRDVSPQNVMVSYDGEAKVIDFGLAKSAGRSSRTMPSTVMGKLGYMSPEQALGKPLDSRSDIYSAAIVLWELLTGRPLFGDGTMAEVVARMAMPQIPSVRTIRPEVSATLDAVVMRALSVSPLDRYARSDEMARALNEIAVRESLTVSSEELGNFVRAMCPEEFAAERQLQAKLSQLRRAASPAELAPPPLEPTSIKSGTKSAQIEGTLLKNSPEFEYTPAQRSLLANQSPIALDQVARTPSQPVAQSRPPQPGGDASFERSAVSRSRLPFVVLTLVAVGVAAAGAMAWSNRAAPPVIPSPDDVKIAEPMPEKPIADDVHKADPGPVRKDDDEGTTDAPKPSTAKPQIAVVPPFFKLILRNNGYYLVLKKKEKLSKGDRLAVVGKPLENGKREYYFSAAVVEVKGALAEVVMEGESEKDDELYAVKESGSTAVSEARSAATLPRAPRPPPVLSIGDRNAAAKTPSAPVVDAGREAAAPAAPPEPAMVVQPFPTSPTAPAAQPTTPTAPAQRPVAQPTRQMPTVRGHIDVRRGALSTYVYLVNDNAFTLSDCYIRLSNRTAYRMSPTQVISPLKFAEIDQKKFHADSAPLTDAMRQGWSLIQCREGDGYVSTRYAR